MWRRTVGKCNRINRIAKNIDLLTIYIPNRLRIRPRFLRDLTETNTRCSLLGNEYKMPIGIAPSAMQKMAHPEGEIGAAIAAGKAGCVYILSTLSTTSLEDVAEAAPDTHKWFQLYIFKNR